MLARRPLRLAAALAAMVALAACGDNARILPSEHATPVAVGSVPATVFPAPTKPAASSAAPTGGPTASASATKAAGGGGNTVKATATNKFEPASLKVKKGAKVTWTAEGVHTVTSGTAAAGADPKGPMKSALPFQTYTVTFDKPGTYKYYCQPHASLGMEGEIVVS